MLIYWIWLATRQNLSRSKQLDLLEYFLTPDAIYNCNSYPRELELSENALLSLENKDLSAARRLVRLCSDKKIRIITLQDTIYPTRLRQIPDMPVVLYCKGFLPDLDAQPTVGVVGTRKASSEGLATARKMGCEIAACGGLVVSGGAAGIDAEALWGALDAGKPAVAVLGNGPDIVYPQSNTLLFAKLEEKGCILSEYPPGTKPTPWQFPERNRIISGMSDCTLVVEAPAKSGALITARDALEQGREVFSVPGSVTRESCAGSNALLRDGASVACCGWDVLQGYESRYPDIARREVAAQKAEAPRNDKKDIDNPPQGAYIDLECITQELDPLQKRIVETIGSETVYVDVLATKLDMSSPELMMALTDLGLMGIIENHPGRMVSVVR
jgi:DNA processing protein